MARDVARIAAGLCGLAASMLPVGVAPAQGPPPTEWSVDGQVLVARPGRDPVPVPGAWVTLNRVGEDSAGVVDSVRTGADGGYRIVFRRGGDPAALYFTDVTYGGVAYFTDPLRGVNVTGEDAELVVFDTISISGHLRLRGRHVVVGPVSRGGTRPVVEVFELTNDTSYTIVPRADTIPVWTVDLPAEARDPEVNEGDLGEHVVRFRNGRAELYAPMSPGLRQLSIRYTLRERDFPLGIRLAQRTEFIEVLIAGSDGSADGATLRREQPVELEGVSYVRFLSDGADAGATLTVTLGGLTPTRTALVATAGATMLILGGALVFLRRRAYPSADN